MFGSIAFLLRGQLRTAVGRDGDLLVRVEADDHDDLLQRPGVRAARMGARRRPMGRGWLTVSAEVLADDAALLSWLDAARARTPQP